MPDKPPGGDGGGNSGKPAESTRPSENQSPGDRAQNTPGDNQQKQLDRYEQISRDLNPAFRDSNKSRLDPTLHSQESLDMINSHLDKVGSVDRNELPKIGERPSEYDVYKADLVKAVFDKNGQVSSGASNRDILKLVDLNNAEAAAWASRIPAAQKSIRDNATLESFGAGTAPGAAMSALSKAMTHDPAAAAKAVDTVQKSLLKQGLNLTTDLPSGSGPIAPTEKTPAVNPKPPTAPTEKPGDSKSTVPPKRPN